MWAKRSSYGECRDLWGPCRWEMRALRGGVGGSGPGLGIILRHTDGICSNDYI